MRVVLFANVRIHTSRKRGKYVNYSLYLVPVQGFTQKRSVESEVPQATTRPDRKVDRPVQSHPCPTSQTTKSNREKGDFRTN